MTTLIIAGILVIHGLVHLMGFSKAWNLGPTTATPHDGQRVAWANGIAWLLTTIILLGSAAAYVMKMPSWWLWTCMGITGSQLLIVLNWREAKYGTWVNCIIALVAIVGGARAQFYRLVQDRTALLAAMPAQPEPHYVPLETLPLVVQRWIATSGTRAGDRRVELRQHGRLRLKPRGAWKSFDAIHYCAIDEPAFVWNASIDMAPMITVAGLDQYRQGKGSMLIKPLYLFTLADTQGPEIDQGTLARYLGEMVWYPQAARNALLTWHADSAFVATATISYEGVTAEGTFSFDSAGRVTSFTAPRYGIFDGHLKMLPWHVTIGPYRKFGQAYIPSVCDVTWKLPEGDYTWLHLEIVSATYQ